MSLIIKFVFWLGLLAVQPLQGVQAQTLAPVYKWQDAVGHTHYSDHGTARSTPLALRQSPALSRVEQVYDGDTLRLQDGRKVRLLGINAPEIASRQRAGEPGGEEAKQWLRQRLQGHSVRLEFDTEKQDKYQRWLAHVFDETGQHINLELVRHGLAFVSIYPPNLRYSDALLRAELQAERQASGIWALPFYAPKAASDYDGAPGWQRLRGTILQLTPGRKYLYLQMAPSLSVRIERDALGLFGEWRPVVGQRLEVRGWPHRRKQGYVIPVRHPSALRIW